MLPTMKTKLLTALSCCFLLSVLVAPVFADAKEKKSRTRKADGTYETDDGKSGTFAGTTTREKGKTERSGSVTNQDGKTAKRDSVRTTDKAAGTSSYNRTTTGPEGKTATVTSESKKNADGTISTEGSRTGFNGKTSTFEATTAKTADGRATTGTVTGPDGKTAATNSVVNGNVSNSSSAANNGPQDNAAELALLVKLPVEPDEVAWKEDPDKKQLVAVLRYSPENAGKLAAEIAKAGQPAVEDLPVESWYPAELVAQGELTGESTVKGRSFPADAFLNPPYTKGKITQIENTDYFILQISS